jgi:hypothetical protein
MQICESDADVALALRIWRSETSGHTEQMTTAFSEGKGKGSARNTLAAAWGRGGGSKGPGSGHGTLPDTSQRRLSSGTTATCTCITPASPV